MQFSKSFIRQVADATDIVDLISDHGVTLKRAGSSYKGLCPFHSEKTPSFNVNPERGFFHCFGCSVSGDGIKFLMQYDRLSFSEAVEELAKRAGIPLEIQSGGPRSSIPEEDRGLHCLKEAAAFYSEKLSVPEGENAVKYLQQRGVPESMWKQFQIGISPDEWQGTLNYLQKKKNFSVRNVQNGFDQGQ
jgi:DNA primase